MQTDSNSIGDTRQFGKQPVAKDTAPGTPGAQGTLNTLGDPELQSTPDTPGVVVAVLIPFHYKERLDWLQQAVDSIYDQQTRHTIRIYLGIDGPLGTDTAPATISDFLTRNTAKIHKTVNNPVNQGLAVMLNRMIDALENESFIMRLDADDIALPGRVETQINWMLAHPETDVCGGYMIETDFTGYSQLITYPLTHAEMAGQSHRRNPIAHPACAVRRRVYADGNRYPTDALYNEDLGMWLQLLDNGYRFANIAEPLIQFRIRDDFYRKRGYLMAAIELKLYLQRLKTTKAPLSAYAFPLMRFVFRFMPSGIKKLGYRSGLRQRL
jgi:glycosyltransferase involved in cell wall biosynthesis